MASELWPFVASLISPTLSLYLFPCPHRSYANITIKIQLAHLFATFLEFDLFLQTFCTLKSAVAEFWWCYCELIHIRREMISKVCSVVCLTIRFVFVFLVLNMFVVISYIKPSHILAFKMLFWLVACNETKAVITWEEHRGCLECISFPGAIVNIVFL